MVHSFRERCICVEKSVACVSTSGLCSWVDATRTAFLFRLLYGMAVVTEPVLRVEMAFLVLVTGKNAG